MGYPALMGSCLMTSRPTGAGVEHFVEQIRYELVQRTYRPMRNRKCEIPKDGNKIRVLSVPSIRDRVVQGALKLILEPIFEADFQPGSYGYRPKRSAHDAIRKVAHEIRYRKTRVIDLVRSAETKPMWPPDLGIYEKAREEVAAFPENPAPLARTAI
jgi:hypothetical protein